MREMLITHKKYLYIPESILTITPASTEIEKLSLHFCAKVRLALTDQDWPNLQFLEIIGCQYIEISFLSPLKSKFTQFYIAHSRYIDFLDFKGNFPHLIKGSIDQCKYVKFKGEWKGNLQLQQLEFNESPQVELFKQSVSLPVLERMEFQTGCHFLKVDLSQLSAPRCHTLLFQNSNYINIVSLGTIEGQLRSFRFENCNYPKLNIDFSRLMQLSEQRKDLPTSPTANFPEANPFRTVKRTLKASREPRSIPTASNSPDLDLIRSTPSETDARQSAEEFLHTIDDSNLGENEDFSEESLEISYTSNDLLQALGVSMPVQKKESPDISTGTDQDGIRKFCPTCGKKNAHNAVFCASCGTRFPSG